MVGLAYRAEADRHFGYHSDVVCVAKGRWGYKYLEDSEFTHVFQTSSQYSFWPRARGFLMVLFRYDILVTFFNGTFFKLGLLARYEMHLLKVAGIKIVSVSYGGDVLYCDCPPKPRFDWINQMRKDHPPKDLSLHNQMVHENIERMTTAADFSIAADYSLSPLHPHDLVFKYFPIDCAKWTPLYDTGNPVPVIVHAPNHRHVKGTDLLLAACDRLHQEGYRFELRLVEGIPRNQVMEIYRHADILVEEFRMGAHGLNGMEFLALGKTVATYLNEDHLRDPACNNGIININPGNVDEVLKVIVSIPKLRLRLGHNGRKAAEQYHSYKATGEVWDRIYRHLWFGDEMDLQTTSHFSPSRQPRSLSEDPCDEDFWPVPVTDLIDEIRAAVAAPPILAE